MHSNRTPQGYAVFCVTDENSPLLLEAVRYPPDAGFASLALPDWKGPGG